MQTLKKVGRPKKYLETPVSFGIKISVDDKKKIKQLVNLKHKPANQAIMELIQKELAQNGIVETLKPVTAEELLNMPIHERKNIIKKQVKKTLKYFVIIEDTQEILEY